MSVTIHRELSQKDYVQVSIVKYQPLPKTMNREQFLENEDVNRFVDWLCERISTIPLNISIRHSRYVPNGLEFHANGINDVRANYRWSAQWTDCNDQPVLSSDWLSTKQSLSRLRSWLQTSLNQNNSLEFHQAAYAALEWGGVRSAKPFLDRLNVENRLIGYFSAMQQAMTLETADLDALNPDLILRFDSGLTKIHAFLADDGLPIYDSRVAAAIAAFVYLYKRETGRGISHLHFPVSDARGNQIRNLRTLDGGKVFSRLYSQASHSDWAKAQAKLGWIISEVLNRLPTLFADENTIQNRMHAMEASLFMIGYDLRCIEGLFAPDITVQPAQMVATEVVVPVPGNEMLNLWGQPFLGIRVPAGHPFTKVMVLYRNFREAHSGNHHIPDFRDWLVITPDTGVTQATTATAYCYPLRDGEMSIRERSDAEVGMLANEGMGGYARAFIKVWRGCDIDEELPNCIADVFIAGHIARLGLTGNAANTRIVNYGFAGTKNAAQTTLAVGRSVGRHFGLLDRHNQPTDYFDEYFN